MATFTSFSRFIMQFRSRGETKRARVWKEVRPTKNNLPENAVPSDSHFRHRSRQDEVTNKGTTKGDKKKRWRIESNSYGPLVICRSAEGKRERH